jgi:hypothetical protein
LKDQRRDELISIRRLRRLGIELGVASCLSISACQGSEEAGETPAPPGPAEVSTRAPAPEVEALPEAAEVLEAHVKAIGGREAIAAIESLYIKSELRLDARKIEGVSEMWWRRAGADELAHFGTAQVLEGVGSNAAGYDGRELWVRDDFNGLRTLDGREAELYQRGSSPFLIAHWKRHFESARTLGRIEGAEGPMLEVELLSPLQQRVVMVFAESDGLLREVRYDELTPQGPRPLVSKPSDYQRVAGVRFAHEQRTQSAHGELVQKTVEVEANIEVDPKRFQNPLGAERVDVDPSKQGSPGLERRK